jgi:hypothetical protein
MPATMFEVGKTSGASLHKLREDYRGIPGDAASPRGNFELPGVYFDTREGRNVIIVLGPAETVEHYRDTFESWVTGFI